MTSLDFINKESAVLKKDIIYFIGLMGSGKSTLSKKLSERLNYNFIDTDILIEKKEKKSISKIFEENGEEYFRKIESSILEYTSKQKKSVVSTGGGVVLKEKNRILMKSTGLVIFINVDVYEIIKNIETEKRPLLKDGKEKLFQLSKERDSLYKEASNIIFDDVIYGDIEKTFASLLKSLKI